MDSTPNGVLADRDASRARDARLVEAALAGDQAAFGRLYDAWYDRVWNLSLGIVRDPEVAAEVTQDAFLSAWRSLSTLDNVDAFGGWLLRIARNASFNRQRKEQRSRPVDDEGLAVIERAGASSASAPAGFGVEDRARVADDPAAFAEDSEMVALVHASASALGERDAEVLDLQLRYGLSPAEIGEVMGMNRNAANQLCHRIRQRFAVAVRARVLWRGDRPACDALAAMLVSAGVVGFDAEAVKIADKHAEACPQCRERRELRLQPAAMFAAVPLVAAPVLFKQQTAHALEGAGVAMDGSAFGSAGSSGASSGDPGASPDTDGTGGPGGGASRHGRRALAMLGVAAVVLLVAMLVFAGRTGDDPVDELAVQSESAGSSTTSTTVPGTLGVEVIPGETTTPESEVPSTETTVPSNEPPPDDTPVSRPTITFTVAPDVIGPVYRVADGPLLSWSVTGAASVVVEGPSAGQVVVLGGGMQGSVRVCPGVVSSDVLQECTATVGTYEYVLRAYDAGGVLVGTATADLEI